MVFYGHWPVSRSLLQARPPSQKFNEDAMDLNYDHCKRNYRPYPNERFCFWRQLPDPKPFLYTEFMEKFKSR
jgi:hypothetical protein